MNPVRDPLKGNWSTERKSVNPTGLLGERDFIRIDVPGKTAAQTEPFGFRHKLFLAAQFFFGSLAILNVRAGAVPPDDLAVLIAQRLDSYEKPAIYTIVPP